MSEHTELPFFRIEFPMAKDLKGSDRATLLDILDGMLDEAFLHTQNTPLSELKKKFKECRPLQEPIETMFADPAQFTMRGYEWGRDGLILTVKPKAGLIAQLLKKPVSQLVEESNQTLSGRVIGWVIRTITPDAEQEVNAEFEEETLQNCIECASHALISVFSEHLVDIQTRRLHHVQPTMQMKM